MCVCNLCLSKKLKRGHDLQCALPLNPQLQYWKFLAFRDFEYWKFFAIHKYWRQSIKIKKDRYRQWKIDRDQQKFLGKLWAASIFKLADPIWSLSTFNLIGLYRVTKSGKGRVKNMSIWRLGGRGFVSIVHSLSSGKVEIFLCAACHAFTPHVNAWKRWIVIVVQV